MQQILEVGSGVFECNTSLNANLLQKSAKKFQTAKFGQNQIAFAPFNIQKSPFGYNDIHKKGPKISGPLKMKNE
jgi:hypothetical protein